MKNSYWGEVRLLEMTIKMILLKPWLCHGCFYLPTKTAMTHCVSLRNKSSCVTWPLLIFFSWCSPYWHKQPLACSRYVSPWIRDKWKWRFSTVRFFQVCVIWEKELTWIHTFLFSLILRTLVQNRLVSNFTSLDVDNHSCHMRHLSLIQVLGLSDEIETQLKVLS